MNVRRGLGVLHGGVPTLRSRYQVAGQTTVQRGQPVALTPFRWLILLRVPISREANHSLSPCTRLQRRPL